MIAGKKLPKLALPVIFDTYVFKHAKSFQHDSVRVACPLCDGDSVSIHLVHMIAPPALPHAFLESYISGGGDPQQLFWGDHRGRPRATDSRSGHARTGPGDHKGRPLGETTRGDHGLRIQDPVMHAPARETTRGDHKGRPQGETTRGDHKGRPQGETTGYGFRIRLCTHRPWKNYKGKYRTLQPEAVEGINTFHTTGNRNGSVYLFLICLGGWTEGWGGGS